jgi:hypothetical protein
LIKALPHQSDVNTDTIFDKPDKLYQGLIDSKFSQNYSWEKVSSVSMPGKAFKKTST